MDLIDKLLTEGNELHYYMRNEEYDQQYMQLKAKTCIFGDRLTAEKHKYTEKIQTVEFKELISDVQSLLKRAEIEGFKMGLRCGIEMYKGSKIL